MYKLQFCCLNCRNAFGSIIVYLGIGLIEPESRLKNDLRHLFQSVQKELCKCVKRRILNDI